MERKRRTLGGISDLSHTRAQAPRTADLIYRELHGDIVSMRLRPGDKISEQELAEHFGVSRTPIRAALLRLSGEGLVSVFPQAGTFVARIPIRLLTESILIRKALETVIVETVATVPHPDVIPALDANLAEMELVRKTDDFGSFHRVDTEFHHIIARFSGLETVVATTGQVRAQIDRYRLLTLPQEGRLERVIVEHRAVRDAIARGDVAGAAAAMGAHIGHMLGEVAALDHLDATYFYDDRERSTP